MHPGTGGPRRWTRIPVSNPDPYYSYSAEHKRRHLELDFGNSPIPPDWKERVLSKLKQRGLEVFSHHDLDFGRTYHVKHHIRLRHDETPFKHQAWPIHPCDIEAVRDHLRDLLEAGVIRESQSPFSSPIVVVRKKNGDVRLCIDYRKLNLHISKDNYVLPNLEESFTALNGSRWFSVLDLKSGYYQIEMAEDDKPKTAYLTPLGFWEFNRMPQGVTNAPSTFQRLMEWCMGDLYLKEVLVLARKRHSPIAPPSATATSVAVPNSGVENGSNVVDPEQFTRRSSRQRQPPQRLQNSRLGNPLVSSGSNTFPSSGRCLR